MVSSGYDGYVRIWSCTLDPSTSSLYVRQEDQGEYTLQYSDSAYLSQSPVAYKKTPFDLAFKPGEPILAVACQDGSVIFYLQLHDIQCSVPKDCICISTGASS
jgi:hypothetical protein